MCITNCNSLLVTETTHSGRHNTLTGFVRTLQEADSGRTCDTGTQIVFYIIQSFVQISMTVVELVDCVGIVADLGCHRI